MSIRDDIRAEQDSIDADAGQCSPYMVSAAYQGPCCPEAHVLTCLVSARDDADAAEQVTAQILAEDADREVGDVLAFNIEDWHNPIPWLGDIKHCLEDSPATTTAHARTGD